MTNNPAKRSIVPRLIAIDPAVGASSGLACRVLSTCTSESVSILKNVQIDRGGVIGAHSNIISSIHLHH
jgi:hypothetical protein